MALVRNEKNHAVMLDPGPSISPLEEANADLSRPHNQALYLDGDISIIDEDAPSPGVPVLRVVDVHGRVDFEDGPATTAILDFSDPAWEETDPGVFRPSPGTTLLAGLVADDDTAGVANTVKVQAAVTAAAVSGRELEVPPGRFALSNNVQMPDFLRMKGAGKDKTVFYRPPDTAGARLKTAMFGASVLLGIYQPLQHVQLEGFSLEGNASLDDPSADLVPALLHSYITRHCTFTDIAFRYSRNYGSHVGGSPAQTVEGRSGYSENVTYTRCDFEKNGVSAYLAQVSTTLSIGIDADDLTITVPSTAGFRGSGELNIEGEVVYYSSKDATTFTVPATNQRGRRQGYPGAAVAGAHSSGATVCQGVTTGDGYDCKAGVSFTFDHCRFFGNGDKGCDTRLVGGLFLNCDGGDNFSYDFAAQGAPHQQDMNTTYQNCRSIGGPHSGLGGFHANAVSGYVPLTTLASDAAAGAETLSLADASALTKGSLIYAPATNVATTVAVGKPITAGDPKITLSSVVGIDVGATLKIGTSTAEFAIVADIVGNVVALEDLTVNGYAAGTSVVALSQQWARVTDVVGNDVTISPALAYAGAAGVNVSRVLRNSVLYDNCTADMALTRLVVNAAAMGISQTSTGSTLAVGGYTAGDITLTVQTGEGSRFRKGDKVYVDVTPNREWTTIDAIAGDVLTVAAMKKAHSSGAAVTPQAPPQELFAEFQGGRYGRGLVAGSNGIRQASGKVTVAIGDGVQISDSAGSGVRWSTLNDRPCSVGKSAITDNAFGINPGGIGYGENILVQGATVLRNPSGNFVEHDPSTVIRDCITDTPTDIASAGTVTLPPDGDLFRITGTTTINTLAASRPGRKVTLTFASTAQLTSNTVLLLNGNLTGGSARVIHLTCQGSTWVESGRRPGNFDGARVASANTHKRSSLDRRAQDSAALTAFLTSGVPFLVGIPCDVGDLISAFDLVSAVGGTNTHFSIGFADPSRVVKAVSNDTTTAALAATANNTYTLTAPYECTERGIHYAVIVWTGSVSPTFYGKTLRSKLLEYAPVYAGATSDTGLTDPASLTALGTLGTITATGSLPYIGAK